MLFSQDKVAAAINSGFEPVWEMVRPVPIVRIDFGDGNVLTRTLHGNILTSVCNADGQVLDALPGIYEEKTYVAQLTQLRLLAINSQGLDGEERLAWIKGYHQRAAEKLKNNETPEKFAEQVFRVPIGKAKIEFPVEAVVGIPGGPNSQTPNGPTIRERGNPYTQQQQAAPAPETAAKPLLGEDGVLFKALLEDTKLNENTRRRQIHELLATKGLVTPDKVTKPIYKDVLLADLDDPYLGLGKTLFANYPFAAEDAKR